MNPELKYRCGVCDDLHDDPCEAMECCPTPIHEVYTCGHCGESFGVCEESAEKCCEGIDPDAPPIINQEELEAAGQMRLVV